MYLCPELAPAGEGGIKCILGWGGVSTRLSCGADDGWSRWQDCEDVLKK